MDIAVSERERLPPFYSGADLHNDQRLSCLSKLFSAICIIFCRASIERTGWRTGEGGVGTPRYTLALPLSSAFYVHDL